MVLIHVVFVQSHQERPMDINICSISMPLPHTPCSMDITYPGIQSLPTPYGLTLHTFFYDQAKVLAICLWFSCLTLECNAILLSPSWHLVGSYMPPSTLQRLIQFLQCLWFKCQTPCRQVLYDSLCHSWNVSHSSTMPCHQVLCNASYNSLCHWVPCDNSSDPQNVASCSEDDCYRVPEVDFVYFWCCGHQNYHRWGDYHSQFARYCTTQHQW